MVQSPYIDASNAGMNLSFSRVDRGLNRNGPRELYQGIVRVSYEV